MKAFLTSSVASVVAFVVLCVSTITVSAQNLPDLSKPGQAIDDLKALAAKSTPKTADGHPDLSGRWMMPNTGQGGLIGRVNGDTHELIYGVPVTGDKAVDGAVSAEL